MKDSQIFYFQKLLKTIICYKDLSQRYLFLYIKNHLRKYLALIPSFFAFGFLFSPSGSIDQSFNTMSFL